MAQCQASTSYRHESGQSSINIEETASENGPRIDTIFARIAALMEEQTAVLRRMDQRQAVADISQQPMPEVSATSSSAWNALLRSALTDTIQPKIDRWRSGLDALLVFLGLFSGIVTAFFVGSLGALKPDETARTNELLTNLTNIVVAISVGANLSVAQPAIFRPEETDVRLNSFWALSLVLSLSLAALAVVCRGFLNMAAFSRDAKASNKLMDIINRWSATERILGTSIEALPLLLVIPVSSLSLDYWTHCSLMSPAFFPSGVHPRRLGHLTVFLLCLGFLPDLRNC
ncbi:hypothetical protein B0H13DRAFT_62585 [Mycena leptocephala]|nr:hypothetical protein B0H13DRAFT_62585 [Mycena leptocephala]